MHAGLEGFRMPSDAAVQRAAAALRLLADPTRINLLCALAQGESSVSCLAELAGASPTAVSQHLAKLRLAGLVATERRGTFVYYTLAGEHVPRLLADLLGHVAGGDPDTAAALAALTSPRPECSPAPAGSSHRYSPPRGGGWSCA